MADRTTQDVTSGRQTLVGLILAAAVIAAWGTAHIYGVFYFAWGPQAVFTAPVLFLTISWLFVGLFIVAHDCMHGSLVPFRPWANKAIGRFCLFVYAGFNFDKLNRKHHLHHRYSGTEDDPDFDARPPHGFLRWYWNFFTEYFGWPQLLFLSFVTTIYLSFFEVRYANLMVFWALPAILSSLQLFYFGTYLPHRPGTVPFADRHRTRSTGYNWLLSLLTCFHFGYHHEHHLYPGVPWWRLPAARRARRARGEPVDACGS